jgi:predicted nucleotidyltransferase
MNFLEDPFFSSLVARLNQPGVIGISIGGSYARGEQNEHSDIDLNIFVDILPSEAYTLRSMDDRLVSLKTIVLQNEYNSLTKPEKAIWAVPGLRHMQILLDDSGRLAALQQAALEFDWSNLQQAANEYAIDELMGCAEEARKTMGGLAQGNESKVLYAVWGLFKGLARAVVVQRGLMIDSENRYFDIIQNNMGCEHEWTRAFRLAFGMEYGDTNIPAYRTRGQAALELYKQTAFLFKDIINDAHREVIENTLQLINRQTA